MKRFGPWVLAVAALMLSSARPPIAIGYDFTGIGGSVPDCTFHRWTDCSVLGSRREAIEEERQRLEDELRARAEAAAAAQAAIDAGLKPVVSIPQQTLYVFRNGELLDTSRVSTGKRGHATPVGTFQILQKKVRHRSNLYANAPMPFMQRLTMGGVALHAGRVPGYPASHGCIRLPWSFAKKLYYMTDRTTRVTVTRARPASAQEALELVPTGVPQNVVSAAPPPAA